MPLLKLKISDSEFRHMQLSALRKPILGVRGIQGMFFRLAKQICSRG